MTAGVNKISNPPMGPALEKRTKTKRPTATVGRLNMVWMMFIRVRLPRNLLKWMTVASGRHIRAARVEEVAEIANDLPAIAMTSGSKDIINFSAVTSPSHSSVNLC
ncbi:hypothetical protein ES708_34581 [subsurface metagenome]